MDILDTNGEEPQVLGNQHTIIGQGFICVFALDDMKSFEVIPQYINRIARIQDSREVPVILVGNKADLSSWTVNCDVARNFAKQKNMPFLVTSALSRAGVEEVLTTLVKKKHSINPPHNSAVYQFRHHSIHLVSNSQILTAMEI